MCGIIGIISKTNTVKGQAIEGLKRLEYRGYDSAGMLIITKPHTFSLRKEVGKVAQLERAISTEQDGKIAIAHTRWATHGKATCENAHPHYDPTQRFAVVHNGTIDNYALLRETYLSQSTFYGDTDSEIVVQLLAYLVIEQNYTVHEALQQLLHLLSGSYALTIVDTTHDDVIYFIKNKSPLIVAQSEDAHYIASDIAAVGGYVDAYSFVDDQTFGEIRKQQVTVWNHDGLRISLPFQVNADKKFYQMQTDKKGYEHFMLKEMQQQPHVFRAIGEAYSASEGGYTFDPHVVELLRDSKKLIIVAAGTSYNAGLAVVPLFNQLLNKRVSVKVASEFAYSTEPLEDDGVYFFFSQSGETADSRAAMQRVKNRGIPCITVTNVAQSTLAREADYFVLIHAGTEVAVASTKAYTAQIATMCGLIYASLSSSSEAYQEMLEEAASEAERLLGLAPELAQMVESYLLNTTKAFYIGRQSGYALAAEAALKLKEISYIQTEGFASGELKHGTIALIEEGTPVIAFITDERTAAYTRSNIEEVRSRGAKIFVISLQHVAHPLDDLIVSASSSLVAALTMIIPAQLIAYYAALKKGLDVDMPRNLAKSVTVE